MFTTSILLQDPKTIYQNQQPYHSSTLIFSFSKRFCISSALPKCILPLNKPTRFTTVCRYFWFCINRCAHCPANHTGTHFCAEIICNSAITCNTAFRNLPRNIPHIFKKRMVLVISFKCCFALAYHCHVC